MRGRARDAARRGNDGESGLERFHMEPLVQPMGSILDYTTEYSVKRLVKSTRFVQATRVVLKCI